MRCFSGALLLLASAAACGQTATPGSSIRTVLQANSNPTGSPPRGGTWSPDGRVFSFIATDDRTLNGAAQVGKAGDILQIETATGKTSVLATIEQLSNLSTGSINEKDRDHRERYSMSSYVWAQDSRHLIVDNGGPLWLYDIASGTGTLIVDTGAGSGDDPKFSPDAKSVSYVRNHNLYVHPVSSATAPEVALTHTTESTLLNGEIDWVYLEELEVRSNYFWSPDSSALAYLQMDETKVPRFPLTDWMPRHAEVDEQRYPQPGDPNPAVRVGIVSATGGATRWVDVPFSQNNDYIPRFGWVDPKTLYIEVLTRDHQHLNLYLADAATGRTRLVHAETDAKFLDDNYDVTFLGGGRFFNTSWKDGHTHAYLYRYDAAHPLNGEAKLVKQLTKGAFDVLNPEVHGDTFFYTSNEGAVLEENLWSMSLDGAYKRRLTPVAGSHEVMIAPDGQHLVEVASADNAAPHAAFCGMAGGCTEFWRSRGLVPAAGVTTMRVTLTAADGKTPLYGLLTMPVGKTPGSTPLILNPYGGPLSFMGLGNTWHYDQLFDEVLAQHGFAVLNVENRGQGGRGREFSQACYRNFGPVQFADQMAALDQVLAAHAELDAQRIGWWGWSWGGSFTLYAMTHTDRVRAGVAVAPLADYRNYDTIYTERYLGLPSAADSPYPAAAAVTSAASLHGRLLLAQGTGDDNVHMSNIIQFIEPLIEAGIPYDLQLFPRKTHSIAGLSSRNELFNRILYQFETYLK